MLHLWRFLNILLVLSLSDCVVTVIHPVVYVGDHASSSPPPPQCMEDGHHPVHSSAAGSASFLCMCHHLDMYAAWTSCSPRSAALCLSLTSIIMYTYTTVMVSTLTTDSSRQVTRAPRVLYKGVSEGVLHCLIFYRASAKFYLSIGVPSEFSRNPPPPTLHLGIYYIGMTQIQMLRCIKEAS